MPPIFFMKSNRLPRPSKAIMCLISTFSRQVDRVMQDLLQVNGCYKYDAFWKFVAIYLTINDHHYFTIWVSTYAMRRLCAILYLVNFFIKSYYGIWFSGKIYNVLFILKIVGSNFQLYHYFIAIYISIKKNNLLIL